MFSKYVIISKKSVGTSENLFWNNEDGWGSLSTASIFNQEQRDSFDLPVDGIWIPKYFAEGGKDATENSQKGSK
jgi:hypothetical protein